MALFFVSGIPIPELPECENSLGMQNGKLPASALRASSESSASLGPTAARLYNQKSSGTGGGWVAVNNENKHWIEFDFGVETRITGVATQGRQDSNAYIKSYSLHYSNDGSLYYPYQEGDYTKVCVHKTSVHQYYVGGYVYRLIHVQLICHC